MSKLILIVEDEVDQRELLADLLGEAGYRTSTAATGNEALHAISAECPALVLADLLLEDMDGRELLMRVRERFSAPPPFVFITGVHPSGTEDVSSEVLLKPVEIENLMAVLGRYCGETAETIFDRAP